MPRPLTLLRASGLPIDWMTIAVAFDGIDIWDSIRLTRDEVKDFALDKLADAAGTDDEELTFLLADADPTYYAAFPSPLIELARRSGVSRETALRKWRHAALYNWADCLRHTDLTATPVRSWQWDEGVWESWYDFRRDWDELVPEPSLPEEPSIWKQPEIDVFLNRCRVWLEDERAQLSAS